MYACSNDNIDVLYSLSLSLPLSLSLSLSRPLSLSLAPSISTPLNQLCLSSPRCSQMPPKRRVIHTHEEPDAGQRRPSSPPQQHPPQQQQPAEPLPNPPPPPPALQLPAANAPDQYPSLTRFFDTGIFTPDEYTPAGMREIYNLVMKWIAQRRLPTRLALQWRSRYVTIDPEVLGERELFKRENRNRSAIFEVSRVKKGCNRCDKFDNAATLTLATHLQMFRAVGRSTGELEAIIREQMEAEDIRPYRPIQREAGVRGEANSAPAPRPQPPRPTPPCPAVATVRPVQARLGLQTPAGNRGSQPYSRPQPNRQPHQAPPPTWEAAPARAPEPTYAPFDAQPSTSVAATRQPAAHQVGQCRKAIICLSLC